MKYGKLGHIAEKKKPGTRKKMGKGATAKAKSATTKMRAEKKNPGTRRKMGKGATAKPKSATTKLRAVKKPKKSKAMYA